MFQSLHIILKIAGLALLLFAHSAWAIVTVGPKTSDNPYENCRFRSIQEAIDYVKGYEQTDDPDTVDHYIVVAGGQVYNEDLRFDGSGIFNGAQGRIDIFGGYDGFCNQTDGSETLISAGGSKSGHSVLQITGNSAVYLHNLTMSNASLGGSGGGISFDGTGLLDLTAVDIADNTAGSGGGIYANGHAPGLTLALHSGTAIERNTVSSLGAGIELEGETFLYATESTTVLENNTAGGNGGAINETGHGSINLAFAQIVGNHSANGAGIHVDPDGSRLNADQSSVDIYLGDGVFIGGNTADTDGGGIYLTGPTQLYTQAPQSPPQIFFNHAGSGGSGGGAFLRGPAKMTFSGAVNSNDAGYGGGIAAFAGSDSFDDVMVRLLPANPFAPVSVSHNSASHAGGGIYEKSGSTFTTSGDDYIYATVCAQDFVIDDNGAQEGTAIYADEDPGGVLTVSTGSTVALNFDGLVTGHDGCPGVAHICAAGVACNEINGNFRSGGNSGDGSTILIQDSSDLQASHTRLQGNQGAHVLRTIGGNSTFATDTLLITDNQTDAELVDSAVDLSIADSTLAHNAIGAQHVIHATGRVTLLDSIVAEDVAQTFDFGGNNGASGKNIDAVLTNAADATMDFGGVLLLGTPQFADVAGGNYHLTQDSPGIDFASVASTAPDLDNNKRNVDLIEVPDVDGPRDLGVYELQTFTPPPPPTCVVGDTIFCNGFE